MEPSTPLPKVQLTITMLIQSAEALSATVIFPFVPQFVRDTGITGGDERKTGYWAGVLESVFFVAEFLSVFSWGRASDHFGRRPVLLLGPLGLALSLIGFGWSKSFASLVFWRCLQGVFNGNIGVVKTVMAEIADSTNLAQIMALNPLAWSSGSTLGPIIGGLLSNPEERWPNSFGKVQILRDHPYLLPCAAVASLSLTFFVFGLIGLKESSPMILARQKREELRIAASMDPSLTTGLLSEDRTTYGAIAGADAADTSSGLSSTDVHEEEEPPTIRELLVPRLVIPLINYGFFCFLQTSYLVLFPLMYSTSIPNGGLGFSPYLIGVTRGIWGLANSFVLLFLAGPLVRRFGARTTYIFAFANISVCISAYPLLSFFAQRVGRVDAIVWAIIVVQLLSNLAMSMAYASIHMFIVNSSPRPSALSSTNSIAQMVSTITRAFAPFIASALFALSLELNLAGGYFVYILLLGIVATGIFSSFLLPSDPRRA
ncbi:major facilitator superfamily multidrug-resistance, DHA1 sub-family [Mycena albidolilacea]|uniref:Major facilitator superfamily multidrug-resistance, DHA1 sub-family n=1 Tax=Mycena albidolilacea TaxID=1033008 RepID=A0AAD7EAC3_9AGAR|nr:major facilitator superfamily multidrug-resistance, DHA1 sub-family [Mycena albidolilacea]